jgi:hypothetical protein
MSRLNLEELLGIEADIHHHPPLTADEIALKLGEVLMEVLPALLR